MYLIRKTEVDMAVSGTAIIVGVGPGLGASLVRRFAAAGHPVAMAARNATKLAPLVEEIGRGGGRARAFALDAADEAAMVRFFADAEAAFGPVEIAIYNCGGRLKTPFVDLDARAFEAAWRSLCLGGMLMAREAARRMAPRGSGSIFFTGGRGSLRAEPELQAFAVGKFGLRALALGLARELGPKGVHVAHFTLSGTLDGEGARKRNPELAAADGLIATAPVADLYHHVHRQPRSAWMVEVELRPWNEGG
jgi:NAD(P)-dependent dehydrogenase (short-subunit alcohol dehydrogenase family)